MSLISNVFEKAAIDQLCTYMNKFLKRLLCGFQKDHFTQYALFKLVQARQKERAQ